MYSVLIADDEPIIRRGLKKLIDWESIGFHIIGEADNGISALEFIQKYNPDVVFLDIKMPEKDGLEIIKEARTLGYGGKVIILSGYSDFKYAQDAIRYGVNYYITKPVDSNLLIQDMHAIADQLKSAASVTVTVDLYREKAKDALLKELLLGKVDIGKIDLIDLNMTANYYQIVIYEKFHQNFADLSYNFSELLRVTNKNYSSFDTVLIDNYEVIILKNPYAIQKFNHFLDYFNHNTKPQKGSPLDSLFITYGRIVSLPEDLPISYNEAYGLMQRRFFCKEDQHSLGYELLTAIRFQVTALNHEILVKYENLFTTYLQTNNRDKLHQTLKDLEDLLYYNTENVANIRLFLIDLFLQIKEKLTFLYPAENIPFSTNSYIIDIVGSKYYLYEIITLFMEQFNLFLNSLHRNSSESILDKITNYINHNYKENIKLENIASMFGYNSSYLGQLFSSRMGESFNSYVDRTRIVAARNLLENPNLKVYQISEMVGYQNVDYFYSKFKKYTGTTPARYRKIKT